MNLVGMISTAVLSLTLVAAAPVFAQEQHDQQEEQKAKPEEKAQPEKSAKPAEKPAAQEEKSAKREEKNAKQEETTKPAEKNAQEQQRAGNNGGGRIPADKFKANFGQQHTFRVSQSDYSNHRFQYGGYSFGFVDAWPSNWLYTQDVYVIEINGVYYLCNASFPGVNLALSFTL
jgi:hypothetical protein